LEHGVYYDEQIPVVASRHLDELLGADRALSCIPFYG
jgi:hypothetical protein